MRDKGMTAEQYDARRAEHVAHLDTLQMALLNAKALSDKMRIKRLSVQIAQVQLILHKEFPKRRLHDPATLPTHFMDACKARLPPEQFAGLIEAAKRLQLAALQEASQQEVA